MTALHFAIKRKNEKSLISLLSKENININEYEIFLAIFKCNFDIFCL